MTHDPPAPVRVLLVEDSDSDAQLIEMELSAAGHRLELERVEDAAALRAALGRIDWDLVISDWSLPSFSALRALEVLRETGSEIPLIIVSGTIGEAVAVDAMRAGARDYVLKDNLARLAPAVERELKASQRAKQATQALRASEARFARLADSGIVSICISDLDGRLKEANPAFLDLLGYGPDALERGLHLRDLTPPEWHHLDELAAERLAIVGFVPPWEKELWRSDGARVAILIGIAKLEHGRDCIAFMIDMSERRSAEERLRRSEERLRQAQKMEAIGSLAGGIAHDFNNLLSIILSYSSMLARDLPEEDPRRAELEQISEAGERAAALTQQLLAFSRRQVLRPKRVDLNELLANVEKMLRRVIGEDIELVMKCGERLRRVEVDPGQIDQVIINLAVNARDAMPQGGVLTLETDNLFVEEDAQGDFAELDAGAYVRLTVTDSGSGMDDATQTRIFEPFFTTKEVGKGTGLGLSTVFGIVQQSGGRVTVMSAPGAGTTFQLYFPGADEGGFRTRTSRPPPSALPTGSETVLLVEDDDGVRELARSILEHHGYRVLAADGGADALRHWRESKTPIHLVLTDVVMAKMSGPELARQLQRERPETQVLFMSGYTNDATVHHGLSARDVDFLPKPFTPETLAKKVRATLDARALRPR
ncbi:MAG TPA: response regulator [Polyangiales bacterium]|nr:response regulator [Polyangiales bacterium]